MNNIKTAERSSLGENLRHLMLWHRMACKLKEDGTIDAAKHMANREVPVMEIIAEWREMAGVKGRYKSNPFPVPTYEYEKNVWGAPAPAFAPAPAPPPVEPAPAPDPIPVAVAGPM